MATGIWLDPVDPGPPFSSWYLARIELHDGQDVVIGRSPACDVVLEFETIGRGHCSISCRDGVFVIEDLITRYGICVNGLRVHKANLAPGDLVELGKLKYVVREGPPPSGKA